MSHRVGQKGQIVIAKEIRDRLGVEPGAETFQRVVGDHVEVYFEHHRSLAGSLAKYATRSFSEDKLREALEQAWVDEEEEREIAGR